jgi:oligopeptidase A
MAFDGEQLKQSRYDLHSTELRQYFTEPRVLQGLFGIAQTLFEVEIRPASAPVWHDSVRYYSLHRGGAPVGHFYLDLHARLDGQRPAALAAPRRPRHAAAGGHPGVQLHASGHA